jgi:hypothetical protein
MKCAIRVRSQIKKIKPNWVFDFIQNPYFLGPEFLPSGRATPETARESLASRRRTGMKRFQKARAGTLELVKEEISYLTVSCDDLPEDPPIIPERIRERSAEGGFCFRSVQGCPIEGPKTEEENQEDQRMEAQLADAWVRSVKNGARSRDIRPSNNQGKVWSPREPDDEISQADLVHVRVYSPISGVEFPNWDLRKGWEWQDFRFLVDAIMQWNPWKSEMAGEPWENEDRKPFPDQRIVIYPLQTPKKVIRWQKRNQDVYEVWDLRHEWTDASGSWMEGTVPDGEGGVEAIANERDYSIVIQMPEETDKRLVRIPRGAEWAFVKQLMDNTIGVHQWYANLCGNIWDDGS